MHSSSFATWTAVLGCLPLSCACGLPIVNISNGSVLGSTSGVVDTFSGIPFAQPPVGELRFRPALPLNTSFGSINATGTPRACPQLKLNYDPHIISQVPISDITPYLPLFAAPTVVGEDCLSLNIQRPSSATVASKLPVLFWIYGGGFNTGSTQSNDFASFVSASVSLGHPILVVQANYRVSAFGFLSGAQIQAEGSSNVGLRDQRLALEWVADNIAAFGGDPDRVTIWGESAGAVSVLYHMLIEGGDNRYNGKPLFSAAMMNSGSSIPAEPADSEGAQGIFDAIAEAGGCGESGHGDAATSDRLACLRNLPYDDLINATNVAPSLLTYTGVALSFPARPDPSSSFFSVPPEQAIREKKIARIPVITGNQADEGTFFGIAMYNGTTPDTLIDRHLSFLYPTTPRPILKRLIDTYATDPAQGSPFGTGDANQLYPSFKRNSALVGDALFIFQRRYQLEHTADLMPAWSYVANYNQSAGTLGTAHGTDLIMFASGVPAVAYNHILQYYISFVNYLDPNLISGTNGSRLTQWPKWTLDSKQMIQFDVDGESTLRDDFRGESYTYFQRIISQLKV
ncbi:Alpha/Beta hydrolase protein [Xylariales sp. AK1849]|nr:Alpha/Beta hydrolase protein [Xylariales sp. AK1849]